MFQATQTKIVVGRPNDFLSPVPMLLMTDQDAAAASLRLPALAQTEYLDKRMPTWVFSPEAYRGSGALQGSAAPQPKPRCEISSRAAEDLWILDGATASLLIPPRADVRVAAARFDDIPRPMEVHVAANIVDHLDPAGGRGPRRALLSSGSLCVPVTLQTRNNVDPDVMRVSMKTRLLMGLKPGGTAQLTSLPAAADPRRVNRIRAAARLADWLSEEALRPIFRAPRSAVRTVQGSTGDHASNLVRLPAHMFSLLGIEEGDQVLVEWGPRRAVAIAFGFVADDPPFDPDDATLDAQAVELFDIPSPPPSHLTVRVNSRVRVALDVPAATVVTIRRKVRPYVLDRLGRATLPLVGAAFAAFALPVKHHTALVVILLALVLLQLAGLRYPRVPTGRWPR